MSDINNDNDCITIKFYINDDVRRFSLPRAELMATFAALQHKVREIDPSLAETPLRITWEDDEQEEVLIGSDCELREAIQVQTSGGSNRLRFSIVTADKIAPQRENECPAIISAFTSKRQPDDSPFPIVIETLTGRRVTLSVNSSEKVLSLKEKIQDKMEIHPDMQRLVFRGKQLEDDCLLNDYNIEEGSVVVLILRLTGC